MTAARAVPSSSAAEQRKKGIAIGAAILIAAGILYFELSDPSTKPAPPSAAVVASAVAPTSPAKPAAQGTAARTVGTTSAALDPTLHMQAMLITESVAYNGTGHNIFAAPGTVTTPLPAIPKPITPVRTSVAPPVAYHPPAPPPPPPIDLKFFGTATTQGGRRQAFLLHGDDVFLAADGDIVQRKYKVITVGPRSVQIEDLTNNNKQTLPLIGGSSTAQ